MKEYDSKCTLYTDFTVKIYELVKELLKENNLPVHSVNYRTKDRSSFEKKLNKSEKKYLKLDDITDISGIRIITYFLDDVDKIATVVEKEFNIDKLNSVDKRAATLDPDRFGYISLHYVAKISPERLKLTEYKRFGTCSVEIQIRSILQHAWDEIEHDLGYKGKLAVPREIRRKFSRLAGLLEIADTEFVAIRDSLSLYEANVGKEIAKSPSEVLINQASLLSYVRSSRVVKELDEAIAAIGESKIVEIESTIVSDIPKLEFAGVKTIGQLDALLAHNRNIIPKFAKLWFEGEKFSEMLRGLCIFYLIYIIVGCSKSQERVVEYLDKFSIGSPNEQSVDIAQRLIKTLSELE